MPLVVSHIRGLNSGRAKLKLAKNGHILCSTLSFVLRSTSAGAPCLRGCKMSSLPDCRKLYDQVHPSSRDLDTYSLQAEGNTAPLSARLWCSPVPWPCHGCCVCGDLLIGIGSLVARALCGERRRSWSLANAKQPAFFGTAHAQVFSRRYR